VHYVGVWLYVGIRVQCVYVRTMQGMYKCRLYVGIQRPQSRGPRVPVHCASRCRFSCRCHFHVFLLLPPEIRLFVCLLL